MKLIGASLPWMFIAVFSLPLLKVSETNEINTGQNLTQDSSASLECSTSPPLHLAIGLLLVLLKQGHDPGAVDCEGKTARDIAIEGKIKEVIDLFPSETKGRNNKTYGAECLSSPLHHAIRAVNSLAKLEGSLEAMDCFDWKPIEFAREGMNSDQIVLVLHKSTETRIDLCNGTQLHLAVINKNILEIQKLLQKKADIYATDCRGMTPFDLAILDNNQKAILTFMKAGLDISKNSLNHLRLAIVKGSKEAVKLLLDLGINNITIQKFISNHLLEALSSKQQSDNIKFLTNDGVKIDASEYIRQFAEEGNVQGLLQLKKINLLTPESVNAVDNKSENPLAKAVKGNYPAVINILLANGANITNCGEKGKTCLDTAIEHNSTDALRTLLGSGMKVDTGGLLLLAVKNDDVASMEILKKFGADLKPTLPNNSTLLHEASERGSAKVTVWLLNNNHSVNERRASDHFTPLHQAARHCRLSVVQELLSRNADVHAVTMYHDTPLHWAAVCGNLKIVQEIISHGGNVKNKCDKQKGWTALHIAARDGHLPVVKELLSRGADINALNKPGHTPLYYAVEEKHNDVIAYLKSRNGTLV